MREAFMKFNYMPTAIGCLPIDSTGMRKLSDALDEANAKLKEYEKKRQNKEPIPRYIKLDSVINDIKKECLSCRYKDTDNCQDCTIDRRIHSIEQLCNSESLYWETWAGDLLKCPICGYEYTDAVECTNFCGNCGVPLQFKKEK